MMAAAIIAQLSHSVVPKSSCWTAPILFLRHSWHRPSKSECVTVFPPDQVYPRPVGTHLRAKTAASDIPETETSSIVEIKKLPIILFSSLTRILKLHYLPFVFCLLLYVLYACYAMLSFKQYYLCFFCLHSSLCLTWIPYKVDRI